MVISARKVDERLQDAPITVNAMSRDALDRQGVRDISQLSNVIPGLSYDQDFGRRLDRPAIRGQSSILGAANAASFLDGVFIPDTLFGTELAFAERIEVIKGPQSALYGRQTFSGAISYVSKKPNMDEFEGRVKGTLATDGEVDILGMVSGPIVKDKLAFQIGANYYKFDGQYRNQNKNDSTFGHKVGDEETKAISVIALFTPTDNLDVTVRYSFGKNNDGQEATALQRASNNNCFWSNTLNRYQYFCGTVSGSEKDINLNLDAVGGGRLLRDTHRVAGIINYTAGDYTITSTTGYTKSDEDRNADIDYQNGALSNGSLHIRDGAYVESLSSELRVVSPRDQRFRWLAGGYYYHEDRDTERYFYPSAFPTYNDRVQNNGRNTIRNVAGFAMAQYDFTDNLTAAAEIRYAQDKLGLVGGNNHYNLSTTYKSWTPRFTLDYKVNSDVMVYGVVARGNKPGGFNSDVRLIGDQVTYEEETAWNYELGFKSEFFDRRVRLNVAAYYIDWSGQQLTQNAIFQSGPGTTTSISYIANVGSLHVKGIEAEMQAAVTDWWTLQLSGSINESKYAKGYDSEVFNLTGNGNLKGKYAPNTPKYQYAIVNNFQTDVGNGFDGFLNLTYSYRSGKYDQVGNFASTGGRHNVDGRIGIENGQFSTALFVRNLFNNRDPLGVIRYVDFAAAGARGYLVGLPKTRQFGVTVDYKF
nr:TonB-dependent receptor [Govania unica]